MRGKYFLPLAFAVSTALAGEPSVPSVLVLREATVDVSNLEAFFIRSPIAKSRLGEFQGILYPHGSISGAVAYDFDGNGSADILVTAIGKETNTTLRECLIGVDKSSPSYNKIRDQLGDQLFPLDRFVIRNYFNQK